MESLFFVRNCAEYEKARSIISSGEIGKGCMLSISSTFPYIVNKFVGKDYVIPWNDLGIIDNAVNRHWIANYPQIEGHIKDTIVDMYGKDDELLLSHHFLLGAVSKLGKHYFQYIDMVYQLISNCEPRRIYIKPSKDFISELIVSICVLKNISYNEI